jgi:hypothetical protein
MTSSTNALTASDARHVPAGGFGNRRQGVDERLRSPVVTSAGLCRKGRDGLAHLQLQLWTDEPPHEPATRPAQAKAGHVSPGDRAATAADEGRFHWTDDAVRRLHVAVLHHALAVLKSKARGNTAEKCEVLRWIWAPAVFCWVTRVRGGVVTRIPIYRRQLPFMFETCCAFDGQRPEVLRDLLEEVLRPLLKELALESLTT